MLITPATWAVTPETGWWWNPVESGRGFNIEIQRGTIYIATFIYDKTGAPIWYSGSGELKDSAVILTLLRFNGGQCIDCAHTNPTSSKAVDPVTVQFTSETNGILSWQGKTVPIERFNFALGTGFEQLLGKWAITISPPSSPAGLGIRLTYQDVSVSDGKQFVEGSISGFPGNPLVVSTFDDPQVTGYQYISTTILSESDYLYSVFSFAGLNKIKGAAITMEKTASPENVAKSLASNGQLFVGYRNLDDTDVTADRVTLQSFNQPNTDSHHEAIDALPSSLQQDSRYTVSVESVNQRENLAVEVIANEIYMQKRALAD